MSCHDFTNLSRLWEWNNLVKIVCIVTMCYLLPFITPSLRLLTHITCTNTYKHPHTHTHTHLHCTGNVLSVISPSSMYSTTCLLNNSCRMCVCMCTIISVLTCCECECIETTCHDVCTVMYTYQIKWDTGYAYRTIMQ